MTREMRSDEQRTLDFLWEVILVDLHHRLSPDVWRYYLALTRAVYRGNGLLRVSAKDAHARDWLSTRLRPLVERSVKAVTDEELEIEFVEVEFVSSE